MIRVIFFIACLGAGCGGASADRAQTTPLRARCAAGSLNAQCQMLQTHDRAVELRDTMVAEKRRCRAAGDDTRLACIETLTHRADQLVMVLSDTSRVDRDPMVVPLSRGYVDALEQTFRQRCMRERRSCGPEAVVATR